MVKASQNEWRRTVGELCEYTGLAPSTVRNAISGDRLKAERDDQGRVVITESAFNEWRENSAKNAPKHLLAALQAKRQKNSEGRYLRGALDFMDWMAVGSTGISFLAKHEELRPAVAQIIQVAVRVLVQHDDFSRELPEDDRERWLEMVSESSQSTQELFIGHRFTKAELMARIEAVKNERP